MQCNLVPLSVIIVKVTDQPFCTVMQRMVS